MESDAGESQAAAEEQVGTLCCSLQGVVLVLSCMSSAQPCIAAHVYAAACFVADKRCVSEGIFASRIFRPCCCVGRVRHVPSLLVQLNDLKRLLLDKDQVLAEYEYERGQMQRRMEELGQRLADKSSSLEGSRSVSGPGVAVAALALGLWNRRNVLMCCRPGDRRQEHIASAVTKPNHPTGMACWCFQICTGLAEAVQHPRCCMCVQEIQALKATIRDQSNAARRQEAALADQNARTRQLQVSRQRAQPTQRADACW